MPKFVQHIRFKTDRIDDVIQATKDIPASAQGEEGAWMLADRDAAGWYVASVVFADAAAAKENDARPETQALAAKMQQLCSDITFYNYDLIYEE